MLGGNESEVYDLGWAEDAYCSFICWEPYLGKSSVSGSFSSVMLGWLCRRG